MKNLNNTIEQHINAVLLRDEIIYRQKLSQCESLIEELFCLYLMVAAKETGFADSAFCLIHPQKEIKCQDKAYRVDFLIEAQIKGQICRLIVECDGHDYHERTKEQAKADKQRERAIKLFGYELIRFTGSEIYNNPFECAIETIEFMKSMAEKKVIQCQKPA